MIECDKPKKTAICDICKAPFNKTCTGDLEKISRCQAVMGFASLAALYFAELNITIWNNGYEPKGDKR